MSSSHILIENLCSPDSKSDDEGIGFEPLGKSSSIFLRRIWCRPFAAEGAIGFTHEVTNVPDWVGRVAVSEGAMVGRLDEGG